MANSGSKSPPPNSQIMQKTVCSNPLCKRTSRVKIKNEATKQKLIKSYKTTASEMFKVTRLISKKNLLKAKLLCLHLWN